MKRPLHLAVLAAALALTVATSPAEWGAEAEVPLGYVHLDAETPAEGVGVRVRYGGPADLAPTLWVVVEGERGGTQAADLVLYELSEPWAGELGADAVETYRVTLDTGVAGAPAEVSQWLPVPLAPVSRQDVHLALVLEGAGTLDGELTGRAEVSTYDRPDEQLTIAIEAI